MKFKAAILLFGVSVILISGSDGQKRLRNGEVYTLQNHLDHGFLTSIGRGPIVVTDAWRDAPTQKYRVSRAYFSEIYMLKPTSNENLSIYVRGRQVAKGSSGIGVANSQYWTVVSADRGFDQIRNVQSNECLESTGAGQRVITMPCRNVPSQQWKVLPRNY